MRTTFLPVCVALALSLTACGTTPAPTTPERAASALAARAHADEGQVGFNKQITYNTVDILGIGAVYQTKLANAGIKTVNALLLAGGKRSDRARLSKATGISDKLLLTWINHGDLMRVTGAGPEYARLLERAGVDTVPELAKRQSANLAAALAKANDLGGGKVATHRVPDETTTTKWVTNAKTFVRLVSY
jgi:predicted flap endonuclease-1-like 5' DNA nuclease